MGLDRELVREAETAREELAVSQHAAERARANYHDSIRRLHAAGGSLREIAEALHLSHQRVHQIINEATEPTRRRWRRRAQLLPGPPGLCSFCGRSHKECTKLIAGPGLFICDRCVVQATRLSAGQVVQDQAEGSMRLESPRSEAKCSFCGKQARRVGFLVASGLATASGGRVGDLPRICDECLDLCLEILAETSPA